MTNPTIVLVHGAFADASSWRHVFDLLGGDGGTVLAPANPLRGVMADAQRPISATAFEEPAAAAAWRTKPSWAVFGTGDRPVAPELHRFQYDRTGSTVTEFDGASHFGVMA
jgi:pimeloyl-ACP methyl ester carboxylesterase